MKEATIKETSLLTLDVPNDLKKDYEDFCSSMGTSQSEMFEAFFREAIKSINAINNVFSGKKGILRE